MTDLPRSPIVRGTAALAGMGVIAALTLMALGRAEAMRVAWPPESDTLFLPSADVLRVASLGHSEMAADLVHARTNVYFGIQIGQHGKQRWLDNYIDTAVRLDPWFKRLYESGPSLLVYNGQRITVETIQQANDILERGIKQFPDYGDLYFMLGFNYFFEMPNCAGRDDPRVPAWREKALRSLEIAAQFSDAPYYLPNLVARLREQRGETELAIRSLERAYATTSSEEAREQIKRKLLQLRGRQDNELLEEGWNDLQARLKACPPYFPEALCLSMGPPPPGLGATP